MFCVKVIALSITISTPKSVMLGFTIDLLLTVYSRGFNAIQFGGRFRRFTVPSSNKQV